MPSYKKETRVSDRFKQLSFPGAQKKKAAPASMWGHLKEMYSGLIKIFRGPSEPNLHGRIHGLKWQAEAYKEQLEKIKKNFESDNTSEAYTFIDAIIDPLIKELNAIQIAFQTGNMTQQAKVFKKYGEWIEKSKYWVSVHNQAKDKREVIDAVVRHLVGEALLRIDRDIEIIRDYKLYQFATIPWTPQRHQQVTKELKERLTPYLEGLNKLKKRPDVISLEGLKSWKTDIDRYRQSHFEEALHQIDEILDREAPERRSENMKIQEQLRDNSYEIVYLQKEAKELLEDATLSPIDDHKQHKALWDHLRVLDDIVKCFTTDAQLSWSLVHALREVEAILDRTRQALSQKSPRVKG